LNLASEWLCSDAIVPQFIFFSSQCFFHNLHADSGVHNGLILKLLGQLWNRRALHAVTSEGSPGSPKVLYRIERFRSSGNHRNGQPDLSMAIATTNEI
jgi:hypothetical protein